MMKKLVFILFSLLLIVTSGMAQVTNGMRQLIIDTATIRHGTVAVTGVIYRVTDANIQGDFIYVSGDGSSTDNGVTVLVDLVGHRFKRVPPVANVYPAQWLGGSTGNVMISRSYPPTDNGALLQISGTGMFSDTLTITTLASSTDSSNRAASTAWVKRQSSILSPSNVTKQYLNGYKNFVTLNTDSINEGTNKFYTDTRARTALSASSPLAYDNTTGIFSMAGGTANTIPYYNSVGTYTTSSLFGYNSGSFKLTIGSIAVVQRSGFGSLLMGTGTHINTTPASGNAVFGESSYSAGATGLQNSLFGSDGFDLITNGAENSFVGFASGNVLTTGSKNSGIGKNTMNYLTTGNLNTTTGYQAGRFIQGAASENIHIGYDSTGGTNSDTISNLTFIGNIGTNNRNLVKRSNWANFGQVDQIISFGNGGMTTAEYTALGITPRTGDIYLNKDSLAYLMYNNSTWVRWGGTSVGGASNPFADNTALVKNNSDNTKLLILSASGISTGTTRTLTAPNANGIIVLNDNTATLTNKTLAAGSNTITGITNANLSGSAGITNANLANSSITINGSSTSLGGTVTVTDANLSTSDVLTNNATTSKHGFVPKLPGNTTDFYRADGTFATPVSSYTLPTASTTVLGGVKVDGTTIAINSGVISLTNNSISINGSAINLGGSVTGLALTSGTLAQFASTTSAQLASIISDETGSGALTFSTSPLFVTPRLASTSTSGFVWTATDASGNGSWQAIPGSTTPTFEQVLTAGSTLTTAHNIGYANHTLTFSGTVPVVMNNGLQVFGFNQRSGAVSANASMLANADNYLEVDATGGARTITLPSVLAGSGSTFSVKKIDASANAVTVVVAGGGTIDGVTSYTLRSRYDGATFIGNPLTTGAYDLLSATPILNSPTFTGIPTAPTAIAGTNTAQLATTAFVTTATASKANLASPTFTGSVVLPSTTTIGTVTSTEIGYLSGVTSSIQSQFAAKANLVSPTFTGVPAGPTAAANTSTTQLATTAFVTTADNLKANIASPTFTGTVTLPSTTSIGTVTSTEIGFVDGVTSSIQTQLNSKAALTSPGFTGVPTAPTAAGGTNTTQLATTAFVNTAIAAANVSGTYTPTVTGTSNVTSTSTSTFPAIYYRVGNVVTVHGLIFVEPTASGVSTTVDVTLPIASTFTASVDAIGTNTFSGGNSGVTANTGNNNATVVFVSTTAAPFLMPPIRYEYSYIVH